MSETFGKDLELKLNWIAALKIAVQMDLMTLVQRIWNLFNYCCGKDSNPRYQGNNWDCFGSLIYNRLLSRVSLFQALKILHNSSEFLPFVIYLCAPSLKSTMKTSSTKTSTAASDVDVNGIDEVDAIVVENGNGKTPTEEIQLNHMVKYYFL